MLDLAVHIERGARYLFGEPNKALSSKHQLRFGNNGSIAVEIAEALEGEPALSAEARGGPSR